MLKQEVQRTLYIQLRNGVKTVTFMKCEVFMKALGVVEAGIEGHGFCVLRAGSLSKHLPSAHRNATPFRPGTILL